MIFYESKHGLNENYYTIEEGHNFSFPPHLHHCCELIMITEGKMEIIVENSSYSAQQGDFALIFPSQIHSLETIGESSHILIIFSAELIGNFFSQVSGCVPENPVFTPKQPVCGEIFKELKPDSSLFVIKGALYLLCDEIIKATKFISGSESKPGNITLLKTILSFVDSNYAYDCSLTGLSEFVKYEKTYLSKFFSQNVGIPYHSYVNQVRISKSGAMLSGTDKTILEISELCGFPSLRSFNRNFPKYTKATPSEYRAYFRKSVK